MTIFCSILTRNWVKCVYAVKYASRVDEILLFYRACVRVLCIVWSCGFLVSDRDMALAAGCGKIVHPPIYVVQLDIRPNLNKLARMMKGVKSLPQRRTAVDWRAVSFQIISSDILTSAAAAATWRLLTNRQTDWSVSAAFLSAAALSVMVVEKKTLQQQPQQDCLFLHARPNPVSPWLLCQSESTSHSLVGTCLRSCCS